MYPERVIKEAITNAVLHRDYRYDKDIQIRIFDSRIAVESPGEFPVNITAATISRARSAPRNPSLVHEQPAAAIVGQRKASNFQRILEPQHQTVR